ncbi:dUTP diphosphatase [Candidatus Desantisbacteria bacterium CG_4_10_14_0_8_um_filter_48_22]|uniref:Deoxyuridine 5'-triphosphate nucleotidohydrolase n=1 Tax=Candidatus Desantisbacteria bacterium CG_4_10_14_0_8_um_filter_48_22 TaxID=1974543 RepID=A0A2M7SCQ5_9BACT|nr:MAG: deoxyuridine 5'-triphosphate nucleotidohydrolase [Candidatus Desantisbacteria bacterium CG1_02_49_89]PIV54391.1 MAG: dUTP diphosphatase [Candidatus Desantisbacteria bacterium CG02_land_8_20_14_3_00_49_13]PIZ17271.1 MAG: dUTP diphosphatase [Candidatus Desantisbacteria bacterium CG_4_10_14_0_8_um_filter_48_22]PJB27641.1 MAG: dUTP diphosphatase [Candidatus Desantisbacteria bacterium CG_4_9_14_3_um_filter_50_7]
MGKTTIRIEKITDKAALPVYMTEFSSGMDLYAAMDKNIVIMPMGRALIPTGIKAEIPKGYELQVRPRSGLAWEYGIGILNSPGTIDSDYRGEIKVILVNLSRKKFSVKPSSRIAQMVLNRTERAIVKSVKSVNATARGSGGFGHTGYK